MPRRSRLESTPWSSEREFRWTCPACGKELTCRSDAQCTAQILVHLASHDVLIPLLVKCITEIEKKVKELRDSEIKL